MGGRCRGVFRHRDVGQEVPAETGVPIHEHHTNDVAQTAELQHKPAHNLEHLAWKLACYADTFGVTAGEAAP